VFNCRYSTIIEFRSIKITIPKTAKIIFGFLFTSIIETEIINATRSNKNKNPNAKIEFKLLDWAQIKLALEDSTIRLLMLIFFIIIFSMANIYGTFALLGYKVYHFTDRQNGYMFGIMGLTGALMQGGVIRFLTEKFKDKVLVIYSTVLMMIGLTLMPYGKTFLGLAIISIILSIGTGVLQPVILAMVSKYAPENKQGAILGLNQSISAFARVLGPLWGGFAFQFMGYQFPFLTGGFFTFLTLLIIFKKLNSKLATGI
jgi:MFS family permease